MRHLLYFLAFVIAIHQISSFFSFENIECIAKNPKFGYFKYCFLKAKNRSYNYFSLKYITKDPKEPIKSVTLNSAFYRKMSGGWKPFMYNLTMDACDFLKNQKKNPIQHYVFNSVRKFTDVNHTCPFKEVTVMEMDNLIIDKSFSNLPVPAGQYGVYMYFHLNRREMVIFKVYGTLGGVPP